MGKNERKRAELRKFKRDLNALKELSNNKPGKKSEKGKQFNKQERNKSNTLAKVGLGIVGLGSLAGAIHLCDDGGHHPFGDNTLSLSEINLNSPLHGYYHENPSYSESGFFGSWQFISEKSAQMRDMVNKYVGFLLNKSSSGAKSTETKMINQSDANEELPELIDSDNSIDNRALTKNTDNTDAFLESGINELPEYVPELFRYKRSHLSYDGKRIDVPFDASSYIMPDDDYVKFLASLIYLDEIDIGGDSFCIMYKPGINELLQEKYEIDMTLFPDKYFFFASKACNDNQNELFYGKNDFWANPDWLLYKWFRDGYYVNGLETDCEDLAILMTSCCLSGEMSIKGYNGDMKKTKIEAKCVIGYLEDKETQFKSNNEKCAHAWTELKLYDGDKIEYYIAERYYVAERDMVNGIIVCYKRDDFDSQNEYRLTPCFEFDANRGSMNGCRDYKAEW